jgi:hypothetical protein
LSCHQDTHVIVWIKEEIVLGFLSKNSGTDQWRWWNLLAKLYEWSFRGKSVVVYACLSFNLLLYMYCSGSNKHYYSCSVTLSCTEIFCWPFECSDEQDSQMNKDLCVSKAVVRAFRQQDNSMKTMTHSLLLYSVFFHF